MLTSQINGNKIHLNGEPGEWFYEDGISTKSGKRPCPVCKKMPTEEGHDGCLKELPGVLNACCGHGVQEGYIHFENGVILRFILTCVEEPTDENEHGFVSHRIMSRERAMKILGENK